MRPSTGVWSILKSPVCITVPTGVFMAMPMASGMLWHTRNHDASKLSPKW